MITAAIFISLLFGYALLSGRASQTLITAPILFTAAGMVLSPAWLHVAAAGVTSNVFLRFAELGFSNQPDIDPIENPGADDQKTARKSDRDWHVIIESEDLAQNLETFLAHDYEVASSVAGGGAGVLAAAPGEAIPASFQVEARAHWHFFPPQPIEEEMTITPLSTPDSGVYSAAMLNLLNSAEEKLYIQLQYIHPPNDGQDADFAALIDAVSARLTLAKMCGSF